MRTHQASGAAGDGHARRRPGGYGDSLGLAALLLADCRAVDDVWVLWVLWKAESANFDTMIGLGHEVLFGAGVAETLAFVRASSHPDRDELLRYVADKHSPWTRRSARDSPACASTTVCERRLVEQVGAVREMARRSVAATGAPGPPARRPGRAALEVLQIGCRRHRDITD
jgi:hypothetical protein